MATVDDTDNSGFLSRWSRRKAQVRGGTAVASEPPARPLSEPLARTQPGPQPLLGPVSSPIGAHGTALAQPPAAPLEKAAPPANNPASTASSPPAPTLADVQQLTTDSDYSAFVARSVTPDVRNAALKKLFTDPHFNVMDGLDTYIGDYNTPDPLPPGMLRKMVQSQLLGLFDDEKPDAPAGTPQAPPQTTPPADENPAVQLQPDDDARRPPAEPGAGPDPSLQH